MNNQLDDFEDKKTIYSVLACGVVAFMTFLVMPLYIGLLADKFGFSESQLGILASMDLVGIVLMSLTGGLWVDRVNWRNLLRGALVWLLICNVLAVVVTDYVLLCVVRLLTGLAGGAIAVVVVKSISYVSDPDRITAMYVVFQIIFQVVGFAVLPEIIAQWGVAGFFGLLNAVALLVLLSGSHFPNGGLAVESETADPIHTTQQTGSWKPLIVLLALALFLLAQVALFAFAERLGAEAGFSAQSIGVALMISALFGLVGAGLGAAFSIRYGRFLPLLISGVIQLVCFYFWSTSISLTFYTALLGIIAFFWNLPLGYQVGLLVAEDSGHKFIAYLPCFQVSGIALGPIVGGIALEQGGYDSLVMVASGILILYLVLLLPIARKQDRAVALEG